MDATDPPPPRRRPAAVRMLWPGLIALLAASVGIGIAAGRFSAATIPAQGPSAAYREDNAPFRPDPIATDAGRFALAEAERGRNWAAQAFPSGLRDCPDPTPAFRDGCAAAMANLAATSAEDASETPAASGDPAAPEASDAYRPPAPADGYPPVIVTPGPREARDRGGREHAYDSDASSDEGSDDQ